MNSTIALLPSELIGKELDWAVAQLESLIDSNGCIRYNADLHYDVKTIDTLLNKYKPSTDWAYGGPIIERKELQLYHGGTSWYASTSLGTHTQIADTPLYAAMRCYVSSVINDTRENPARILIPTDL